jgi:hypothetical protein
MNPRSFHLLCPTKGIILLIASICCTVISCEKDPEPVFSNNTIMGSVYVYFDNDARPEIKVVATGPYGQMSVTADADNRYEMKGLGNGCYTVEFIANGFGRVKQYGIELFGNDTAMSYARLFETVEDFEMPNFRNFDPVNFILETDQKSDGTNIVFFFDTRNTVNYKDYRYVCREVWGEISEAGEMEYHLRRYVPFKSGTEVFLIGYACNGGEANYPEANGWNFYMGTYQFSTLIPEKHSEVLSFIMP